VNIAARLEPLASAEGICFSKAFYDLVKINWSADRFTSMGFHHLKNISHPVELYKFNFPWDIKAQNQFDIVGRFFKSLLSFEMWPLVSLFTVCIAFLGLIFFEAFMPQFQVDVSKDHPHINLSENWQYSIKLNEWQPFNPKQSWQYADSIKGPFSLMTEFVSDQTFTEPSMILGLIPEVHRAYLNGQFIGGSDHHSDLAIYTFNPDLIKKAPEKNVILINATSRSSLNPGLTTLSGYEPQVADYSVVNALHSKYYFKFYILKNIFFVFSFIIFILSLIYAVYLKNKNEIFYSSLFLLLGCLHFAYYNPWVSSTFDYQFLRFLRLNSIVLATFVLISGYLSLRQFKKMAILNNVVAVVVSSCLFIILNFSEFRQSEEFVSIYNWCLLAGFTYGVVFSISAVFKEIVNRIEFSKKRETLEVYCFLAFMILSLSSYLGAFKNGKSEIFFSASARTFFNDFGIFITFVFAMVRITLAVFEFTKQKRQNMLSKKKDDFFIELTKIVSQSYDSLEKIECMQKLAKHYIKANKSTLYIVNTLKLNELLLSSCIGNSSGLDLKKSTDEGVFGYVLSQRQPLLIEDINQDYRFEKFETTMKSTYKSGACLLFPLYYEDQALGVLTFSDKDENVVFDNNDLETGLKASSFISLLIASQNPLSKVS
jgi:hypothetical protein